MPRGAELGIRFYFAPALKQIHECLRGAFVQNSNFAARDHDYPLFFARSHSEMGMPYTFAVNLSIDRRSTGWPNESARPASSSARMSSAIAACSSVKSGRKIFLTK